MPQATTADLIRHLDMAFTAGAFEPFIRDLRFPYYKNFSRNARVDFTFPITVITGQNGTNKSSILKTLYGCCATKNLSELWFSSATDKIVDHIGGSTRFIYSYIDQEHNQVVEVLQNHRRRTRHGEELDPDYWETSKPSKKDGMKHSKKDVIALTGRTRWEKIQKAVTIIDFRSELSAYDRFFYHMPLKSSTFSDKRDFVRSRAIFLQQALTDRSDYARRYGRGSWNIEYQGLPADLVAIINQILGKSYQSIVLLNHNLFGFAGSTVSIQLGDGTNYTEAFAGSGEFAVIMLAKKFYHLDESELVLIDEPEMSLHPSAQKQMINYICATALRKKLQIVISTHSPFIIEELPKQAIKTLYNNGETIDILQDCEPGEAFFHISPTHVRHRELYFEDRLAAEIFYFAAKTRRSVAYASQFSYNALPGGHTAIKGSFVVAASQSGDTQSFYIIDGDQRPAAGHKDPTSIPESDNRKLDAIITAQTGQKIKFSQNSNDPATAVQVRRDYLSFYLNHVYYFPRRTPEELLVENSTAEDVVRIRAGLGDDYKQVMHQVARERLRKLPGENITGEEIFGVQKIVLAELPENNADYDEIIQVLDAVLAQRV